jgi:hypothetical protein
MSREAVISEMKSRKESLANETITRLFYADKQRQAIIDAAKAEVLALDAGGDYIPQIMAIATKNNLSQDELQGLLDNKLEYEKTYADMIKGSVANTKFINLTLSELLAIKPAGDEMENWKTAVEATRETYKIQEKFKDSLRAIPESFKPTIDELNGMDGEKVVALAKQWGVGQDAVVSFLVERNQELQKNLAFVEKPEFGTEQIKQIGSVKLQNMDNSGIQALADMYQTDFASVYSARKDYLTSVADLGKWAGKDDITKKLQTAWDGFNLLPSDIKNITGVQIEEFANSMGLAASDVKSFLDDKLGNIGSGLVFDQKVDLSKLEGVVFNPTDIETMSKDRFEQFRRDLGVSDEVFRNYLENIKNAWDGVKNYKHDKQATQTMETMWKDFKPVISEVESITEQNIADLAVQVGTTKENVRSFIADKYKGMIDNDKIDWGVSMSAGQNQKAEMDGLFKQARGGANMQVTAEWIRQQTHDSLQQVAKAYGYSEDEIENFLKEKLADFDAFDKGMQDYRAQFKTKSIEKQLDDLGKSIQPTYEQLKNVTEQQVLDIMDATGATQEQVLAIINKRVGEFEDFDKKMEEFHNRLKTHAVTDQMTKLWNEIQPTYEQLENLTSEQVRWIMQTTGATQEEVLSFVTDKQTAMKDLEKRLSKSQSMEDKYQQYLKDMGEGEMMDFMKHVDIKQLQSLSSQLGYDFKELGDFVAGKVEESMAFGKKVMTDVKELRGRAVGEEEARVATFAEKMRGYGMTTISAISDVLDQASNMDPSAIVQVVNDIGYSYDDFLKLAQDYVDNLVSINKEFDGLVKELQPKKYSSQSRVMAGLSDSQAIDYMQATKPYTQAGLDNLKEALEVRTQWQDWLKKQQPDKRLIDYFNNIVDISRVSFGGLVNLADNMSLSLEQIQNLIEASQALKQSLYDEASKPFEDKKSRDVQMALVDFGSALTSISVKDIYTIATKFGVSLDSVISSMSAAREEIQQLADMSWLKDLRAGDSEALATLKNRFKNITDLTSINVKTLSRDLDMSVSDTQSVLSEYVSYLKDLQTKYNDEVQAVKDSQKETNDQLETIIKEKQKIDPVDLTTFEGIQKQGNKLVEAYDAAVEKLQPVGDYLENWQKLIDDINNELDAFKPATGVNKMKLEYDDAVKKQEDANQAVLDALNTELDNYKEELDNIRSEVEKVDEVKRSYNAEFYGAVKLKDLKESLKYAKLEKEWITKNRDAQIEALKSMVDAAKAAKDAYKDIITGQSTMFTAQEQTNWLQGEIASARKTGDTSREVELLKTLQQVQVAGGEESAYWVKKQYLQTEIADAKKAGDTAKETALLTEYLNAVRDGEATTAGYQDEWVKVTNRLKEISASGSDKEAEIARLQEQANQELAAVNNALSSLLNTGIANTQKQIDDSKANGEKWLAGLKDNYKLQLEGLLAATIANKPLPPQPDPQIAVLTTQLINDLNNLKNSSDSLAQSQISAIQGNYPLLSQINATIASLANKPTNVTVQWEQPQAAPTPITQITTLPPVDLSGVAGSLQVLSWPLNNLSSYSAEQVNKLGRIEYNTSSLISAIGGVANNIGKIGSVSAPAPVISQVAQVVQPKIETQKIIDYTGMYNQMIGYARVTTKGITILTNNFIPGAGMIMPSFDIGSWDVDKTRPAIVHEHEMIIPKPFAEDLRKNLKGGNGNKDTQTVDTQSIVEQIQISNLLLKKLAQKEESRQREYKDNNDR